MGLRQSLQRPQHVRPSRHAWTRIQDVSHVDSDDDGISEDEEMDRRIFDEKIDWPRTCPVLHLDIHNDFPLDAQRSFVRSVYRFWLFSWWISVVNFAAVMATLLTSNVTNPGSMVLSFIVSILYLFLVFLLYFRSIYWAMRLESTTLFLWFFFMTLLLVIYFAYFIAQALSLVSILSQPLAPGQGLPVKINPIFPVALFTIVVACYVLCIAMCIYFFASGIRWMRMTDKQKLKLYRKQKKKRKWLGTWYGGGDDGEVGDESFDGAGKPKFSYECTMLYQKSEDDYLDKMHSGGKKKRKRVKKKGKSGQVGDMPHEELSIPGTLGIYTKERKVVFTAKEPIFSNVFTLTIMMVNTSSLTEGQGKKLVLVEDLHPSVLEEDSLDFQTETPKCAGDKERTFRVLKFDFLTKQERNTALKNCQTVWKAVKKKEQYFYAEDEQTLSNLRLQLAAKTRERAAQHLLTHKDWKLLVSHVWRSTYKAGGVIIPKGSDLAHIYYITSGVVSIFLDTSKSAKKHPPSELLTGKDDHDPDGFDLQSALFPVVDVPFEKPPPDLASTKSMFIPKTQPRYFTATFHKKKLGFSYSMKKRQYNLRDFEPFDKSTVMCGSAVTGPDTENIAATVLYVRDRSQAEYQGVKAGDELVKVGHYNIEDNKCSQKVLTSLIKSSQYPVTMQFRRPPETEFEVDESGLVEPDAMYIPEPVRRMMLLDDEEDADEGVFADWENGNFGQQDEQVDAWGNTAPPLLTPALSFDVAPVDTSMGRTRRTSYSPGTGASTATVSSSASTGTMQNTNSYYDTSDEESGGSSSDAEVDLISFNEEHLGQPQHRNSSQSSFAASHHKKKDTSEEIEMVQLDMAEELAEQDDDTEETLLFSPSMNHKPRSSRRSRQDPTIVERPSEPSLLQRGTAWLFGREISYSRKDVKIAHMSSDEDSEDGRISVVIEGDEDVDDDDDVDGDSYSTASDVNPYEEFDNQTSFEPVGNLEHGDSFGIIPWILNHPHCVVQLVAKSDVVLHSIKTKELEGLFRANPSLALAFFKYVCAIIGERADRDEERLCEQLSSKLLNKKHRKKKREVYFTRLLDDKPLRTTTFTAFEKRAHETEEARNYFETDFDMAFEEVIFTRTCTATLIGDVTLKTGSRWSGVDTTSDMQYAEPKKGMVYITGFHLCFRSFKRKRDLFKTFGFKGRPALYGKLHLNDVFDIEHDQNSIKVATDEIRLELHFVDGGSKDAAELSGWLKALVHSNSVVERAPHSYTLPGDIHNLTGSVKQKSSAIPALLQNDPINIAYSLQRNLRDEFLILSQTLQQVLTNEDRYRLFHDGRSVTLKANQNVISAAHISNTNMRNKKADPDFKRRTTHAKPALDADGPNGLYLVGKGELVVQREVNGRRVQFASYQAGTIFGVERFLTGSPSPFTVKVSSKTALLKFVPRERCMILLRSDAGLAARFYQYCALLQMQRLRGPIMSRPTKEHDIKTVAKPGHASRGCAIL